MWICAHNVILPIDCFEIHIIHMFNKRAFAIEIYYDLTSIYEYDYTWGSKLVLYVRKVKSMLILKACHEVIYFPTLMALLTISH